MSDGSAVPAAPGAPGPGGPGRPLVAGVDCSTQATKVLVVEAESGEVVAAGREGHVVTGEGGARESDPLGWWDALRGALDQVGEEVRRDIRAIAVAGQQHGLVTLDGGGRPVRPALLWNDTRSALDAAQLVEALGAPEWAARTGSRPAASFTVTKWAWLRRTEPDSVRTTAAVRLPHDHLTERLCGAAVTDRGDASGTGWWSPATESYDGDVLALPGVDLDPALLPAVSAPFEPAGTVTAAAASELGLAEGVVVGPGTGDNMASALGLGLPPGQPAISLGTSGTVFMVSGQRSADPSGVVAGFADATGRFLPLACTLNCTAAVDRVAAWLHLGRDDVAPAGDVVVLPYFDGERTPNLPEARGLVTGLDSVTTPGQVLMAAYEGAVASLIEALDALSAHGGGIAPEAPLVVVGGGAAGRTWREVVRRLSGRALRLPDRQELTALGAAVQAAAVWREEPPEAVTARWRTDAGTVLDPLPRDDTRLARIRTTLASLTAEPPG
jgi:xylulokinase